MYQIYRHNSLLLYLANLHHSTAVLSEVITEDTKNVGANIYDKFLSMSAVSSVVKAFKVIVLELPS
jgi:hypothetical protein